MTKTQEEKIKALLKRVFNSGASSGVDHMSHALTSRGYVPTEEEENSTLNHYFYSLKQILEET